MKLTDQKIYNNTYKYLMPLYDYNFNINNESLEHLGCFIWYSNASTVIDKTYVLYKILDKQKIENISFPMQHSYEFINRDDNLFLLLTLDMPDKFKYDRELMLKGRFKDISSEARFRIISKSDNPTFYSSILMQSPNLDILPNKRNLLYRFDDRDIINL